VSYSNNVEIQLYKRGLSFAFREGVECHHLYGDLGSQVEQLRNLTGPVYAVERAHAFKVTPGKRVDANNS
jgi:hypothetical protein